MNPNINLPFNIIETITEPIPFSTKRVLNKLYKQNNDVKYCERAANIYHDDLVYTKTNIKNNVIYYYNDDYDTEAQIKLNELIYIYKITKVNDEYYVLKSKNINKYQDINNNTIIDIDLLSKFQILKNRGCEDIVPNYTKQHILKFLLNTFVDNFNPESSNDLIYLYMYLHSNLVLLGYNNDLLNVKIKINKQPKVNFLTNLYDMYNLLYVHFDILKII
jgi:hypothetical protein